MSKRKEMNFVFRIKLLRSHAIIDFLALTNQRASVHEGSTLIMIIIIVVAAIYFCNGICGTCRSNKIIHRGIPRFAKLQLNVNERGVDNGSFTLQ